MARLIMSESAMFGEGSGGFCRAISSLLMICMSPMPLGFVGILHTSALSADIEVIDEDRLIIVSGST